MDINWAILAAGIAIAAIWMFFRMGAGSRRVSLGGLFRREVQTERRGMGPGAISTLLRDMASWAARQPDVRGVALIGAFARAEAMPGTEVDLVLLTETPERYAEDSWLQDLDYVRRGHPVLGVTRAVEPLASAITLALRGAPALKLRVASPSLATARPPHGLVASAVADGLVIVHDPDGIIKDLQKVVLEES